MRNPILAMLAAVPLALVPVSQPALAAKPSSSSGDANRNAFCVMMAASGTISYDDCMVMALTSPSAACKFMTRYVGGPRVMGYRSVGDCIRQLR